MTKVHSPAVAGQFYPSDADTLKAVVDGFLDSASARPNGRVQALIVPHAGYVFSGAVAAEAYTSIAPTERYERVFLIGPSHREAFRGASVDVECDWYETPIGRLRVDTDSSSSGRIPFSGISTMRMCGSTAWRCSCPSCRRDCGRSLPLYL